MRDSILLYPRMGKICKMALSFNRRSPKNMEKPTETDAKVSLSMVMKLDIIFAALLVFKHLLFHPLHLLHCVCNQHRGLLLRWLSNTCSWYISWRYPQFTWYHSSSFGEWSSWLAFYGPWLLAESITKWNPTKRGCFNTLVLSLKKLF